MNMGVNAMVVAIVSTLVALVGCHGREPLSAADGAVDVGMSAGAGVAGHGQGGVGVAGSGGTAAAMPGRGGSGPSGSGAGSGSSGTAGDDAGTGCYGACLESFFGQCPRGATACTTETSATQVTTCYENGVKAMVTAEGTTNNVVVKKPNGDLCYRITIPSTMSQTVSDPAGTVVAIVQFLSQTHLSVMCRDGSTTDVDLTSPACLAEKSPGCSSGSCSW